MRQRLSFYSKEKRDDLYFTSLSPAQRRVEKGLNIFYISLMILTFAAAFVIGLLARVHIEMTFLGMAMCEVCLFMIRRNTIPLFDIQFQDHQKKAKVSVRENVLLIWVGLGFLLFIGYVMMYVGLHDYIYETMRRAAAAG